MKKTVALALALGLLLGCTALAQAEYPTLTVTSDLVGLVDTFGKTSAKNYTVFGPGPGDQTIRYYNEAGERVAYEDQDVLRKNPGVSYVGTAVFTIEGADDSLIDTSEATVKLVDTSMAPAADYILSDTASKLNGEWSNGVYTYTLGGEDILINQYRIGHALTNPNANNEPNSGFEWSTMGGDGNGVYYLRMEVSGIRYDGKELAPQQFPVTVFCYGRENSMNSSNFLVEYHALVVDEAYTSGVAATDAVQWNWHSDNSDAVEPYMNDTAADYISVIWPEGTDATAITADDVTIILYDAYGESRVLEPVTAYGEQEYTVLSHPAETVVAVTYEQWSWYPAYCTMEVSVDNGALQAANTFTVSSVSASGAHSQQGGGEQDGIPYITAHTFNGVTGWEVGKGVDVTYTLSTDIDGVTWYYDGEQLIDSRTLPTREEMGWGGNVRVVTDLSSVTFTLSSEAEDSMGILSQCYISVDNGHTYCVGTNLADPMLVDMEVSGQTYTMQVTASVSTKNGFSSEYLLPGFNTHNTAQSKWGYPMRFQSGWLQSGYPKPEGLPYVNGYYGYTPEQGSNPLYAEAVANALNTVAEGEGLGIGGPGAGSPGAGGPGAGGPGAGGPGTGGPNN